MGRSVIINTRRMTVEEASIEYGVKGRRLKTLLALVEEVLAKPLPKFTKEDNLLFPLEKKAAKKRARRSR